VPATPTPTRAGSRHASGAHASGAHLNRRAAIGTYHTYQTKYSPGEKRARERFKAHLAQARPRRLHGALACLKFFPPAIPFFSSRYAPTPSAARCTALS